MRNLLIYTNPSKKFDEETEKLVRVHIDNSFGNETLLFTNFPFNYNGVTANIVDSYDLSWDRTSNKIFVIRDLLEQGLSGHFWYHDFDAFQNYAFTIEEDFALTNYGYKDQVNGGSFFFNEDAKIRIAAWCLLTPAIKRKRADEKTMTDMIRAGLRHKMLGVTYNYNQRAPTLCPVPKPKVLHFHPDYTFYTEKRRNLDIFQPIMSKKLTQVFKEHGIK